MGCRDPLRAQPESVEALRPVAEHDDVGAFEEAREHRGVGCRAQIQQGRTLARSAVEVLPADLGQPRRVDAQHVGSEVSESARGDGSGDDPREVEHADTGERRFAGSPLPGSSTGPCGAGDERLAGELGIGSGVGGRHGRRDPAGGRDACRGIHRRHGAQTGSDGLDRLLECEVGPESECRAQPGGVVRIVAVGAQPSARAWPEAREGRPCRRRLAIDAEPALARVGRGDPPAVEGRVRTSGVRGRRGLPAVAQDRGGRPRRGRDGREGGREQEARCSGTGCMAPVSSPGPSSGRESVVGGSRHRMPPRDTAPILKSAPPRPSGGSVDSGERHDTPGIRADLARRRSAT